MTDRATPVAHAQAHRALTMATLAGVMPKTSTPRIVVGADATSEADLQVITSLTDALDERDALSTSSHVVALLVDARAERGVDAAALGAFLDHATAHGLVLVEPEIVPALSRVRHLRTPRGRILLSAIALDAAARVVLFVPAARAMAGVGRIEARRISGGWASGGGSGSGGVDGNGGVVDAAFGVLRERGAGAIGFTELLREGRERWTEAARLRGERVTPSASDARELSGALVRAFVAEDVDLYVIDPNAPAWRLTIGRPGPIV